MTEVDIDTESAEHQALETFIARWNDATGSERANCQLFLAELCAVLGLEVPDPASSDTGNNAYVFERRVTFQDGLGGERPGFIDLYRRDCFVLEAKQSGKALDSGVWDTAMRKARMQAMRYARTLPRDEGRPPFVVVSDVGRSIELYSEFSRTGGEYVAFPDPKSHRIRLEDLKDGLLIEASHADWRHVEPTIFGTLLERALDPVERHNLGAHYTPRAYVERLVIPTVIEPLRDEWTTVQAAALTLDVQKKRKQAVKLIRAYHERLCSTRVLDPACGSGNFLYVALEHLKRLEGEVLNSLLELGEGQGLLEMEGVAVRPHQFLGIEANPRAARIAETVIWIGYLQWHFRSVGNVQPPEPVLSGEHTIEDRDAVLAWSKREMVRDETGKPVMRWDGVTLKTNPLTGREVPDESAAVIVESFEDARHAEWPEAEFIVGNPPFIGTARMRQSLGDGYVEALRLAYPEVPESADYVMYWWHRAAELAREGRVHRFGFITTNSLRQTFNRRVVEQHLSGKPPLSLVFAIPDHPWVDSTDGADVRIAMTVGESGTSSGVLSEVSAERNGHGEGLDVELVDVEGRIHADLSIGANVTSAGPLKANFNLSTPGVKLHGSGFIIKPEKAGELGLGRIAGLEQHIRLYRNGRDLTQKPRGVMVIDLHGLSADETRARFPEVYQHVLERVKPERDQNNERYRRENWWLFGRKNTDLRAGLAGLPRYIATVETSKHRFFVFLDESILPDNMLVNVALDDALVLGVLSSRIHVVWALAAGGRLGVGNDPRYNKTRCFDTFPFPLATDAQAARIRDLAEQLDAHRKRQQELHPDITMTGMYNVLEKLRNGEPMTPKEQQDHELGLVSVLGELHSELDAAVAEAYGWSPDLPDQEILNNLVELNALRAAEERSGIIHWLRPDYQNPKGTGTVQTDIPMSQEPASAKVTDKSKDPWPRSLPAQVQAIRTALENAPIPQAPEAIARNFRRARTDRVEEILQTLESLGQAHLTEDGLYSA